MTPPLKIALIGGGLIGPRHALSIASNPSTTLIALVEPSPHGPSTASSLSTTHHVSISSLLSTPILADAAVICTPNSTHVPLALELIEAGIHVLVEKPVSENIGDGVRLIAAAKAREVKILVGHHRRFNPYVVSAGAALAQQALGTIIAVHGIWALQKPPSYFQGGGAWRRKAGVVMINLVHEIDTLQFLLGPIEYVSALATRRTRGYEGEEGAAILMRFESGIVGTFVLSDASPSPWNFEAETGENPTIPHVPGSEAGGFYRILGTSGSLSVPDNTIFSYPSLPSKEAGWDEVLQKEALKVDVGNVPFDEQIAHFVRVVRGQEEPSCSGEEGLRAVAVCEAVKRSLETGRAVEVRGFELVDC